MATIPIKGSELPNLNLGLGLQSCHGKVAEAGCPDHCDCSRIGCFHSECDAKLTQLTLLFLVGQVVNAVSDCHKGRRPEANKNPKALSSGLFFSRTSSTLSEPDRNTGDD